MSKNRPIDAETLREENEKRLGIWKSFREIYKGVKIPWGQYILALIITCLQYLLLALTADYTADIVAGKLDDFTTVIMWAALHLTAFVLSLGMINSSFAGIKLVKNVQSKLWNQIVRLPNKEYDKQSPNRLISRVTSDAEIVVTPFTLMIVSAATIVVFLIGVLMMSRVNDVMTTCYVVGYIIVLLFTVYVCMVSMKAGFQTTNRLSKLTAFLSERLSNIRLIKASGSEDAEIQEVDERIELRYQAGVYTAYASALYEMASGLGTMVLYIAALLVGAVLLQRGVMTDSTSVYNFYMQGGMVSAGLIIFMQIPAAFAIMLGMSSSFAGVLHMKQEDTISGEPMPEESRDIILQDVSFGYREEQPVLHDIHCVIPKGKITAIVGPNGTGKSTLMKLIDRLYPTQEGSLLYGDMDAGRISLSSWREKFGLVAQNASLFGGSIRDNICYGIAGDVSDEELWNVARLAKIDEMIEKLPEKFEFQVGPSGSNLSGGEQQRVAIARAMMKNPEYLILDEATASLDAKAAKDIQESLGALMQGRTTIMIAHNPALVQKADNIIVMEEGTITACGSHDTLVKENKFYQKFICGIEE